MGLMQLLAVGHTFRGIRDTPSPYRIAKETWLPRFGPEGSAGEVKPPVEPLKGGARADASPAPVLTPAAAVKQSGATLDASALSASRASRQKLPFYIRMVPFRSSTRFQAPLRQGELSLDKVTVVRNDLRDSDIDVVPKKQKPTAAPVMPVESPASANAACTFEFDSLADRLLQAGQTHEH